MDAGPLLRRLCGLVLGLLVAAVAAGSARADDAKGAGDLAGIDLSGEWYVLIHYKERDSENPDITKFKDFAWSIEQRAGTMTWEQYPYVLFDDETELIRRQAMTEHLDWSPDEVLRGRIAQALEVSSRAMTRKRLTGSAAEGFKSLAPLTTGGLNEMSFTTHWDIRFEPSVVTIVLTDSLSGSASLVGMEESTVFEIRERVGPKELRGTYRTENRQGTLWMLQTAERRVVK